MGWRQWRAAGDATSSPNRLAARQKRDWQIEWAEDRLADRPISKHGMKGSALIQFLRDVETILKHVVEQRIVADPKNPTKIDMLFSNNLKDADTSIDEVMGQLEADQSGR